MNHDLEVGGNTISYNLPSLFRGLYSRVARKLGIDPSYVSRVARGERSSDAISRALYAEIRRVSLLANGNGRSRASRNGHGSGKTKAKHGKMKSR